MELSNKGALQSWIRNATSRLDASAPDGLSPAVESGQILPDFCRGWIIFNVIVMAEMLAIVITLVVPRYIVSPYLLQNLLLISLYVQWVALSGTAVLCVTRRYLNKLPKLQAIGMAYVLLLGATWLVTECTIWMLWLTGEISSLRPEWYSHLHIVTITISAFVYALLLRYFVAKHELKQATLSEERTRTQAMLSRIRPHFVFGSMNIIASLIRSDPVKAESAIEDMADLFRMMLNQEETLVPVKNEIDVAKKYLTIERLRLDERLRIDWDIGKFPRKAVMPVLTLQPLLENAIRHGIEPIPAGGTITVRLSEQGDKIYIKIMNPIPRVRAKRTEDSHSMSLDDIRLRFRNHYGDAAKLEFGEEGDQFIVTVVLPTRKEQS
ncbi:MAG: sensor histidine kinase [Nitrospira sp.]|nr:sensor histidine kinase [Nitrospira sp.]